MSMSNSSTILFHSLHVNLHDSEAISGKVSPLIDRRQGSSSESSEGRHWLAVMILSTFIQIAAVPRHEHSENRCEMIEQGMEHTVPLAVCSPGPTGLTWMSKCTVQLAMDCYHLLLVLFPL